MGTVSIIRGDARRAFPPSLRGKRRHPGQMTAVRDDEGKEIDEKRNSLTFF